MSSSLRRLAPAVLLACVGLSAGCESNNKGKIEGRWKIVAMPDASAAEKEAMEETSKLGAYTFIEFKRDGSLTVGVWSDRRDVISKITSDPKMRFGYAKYKLLARNSVEFYDLPKTMQPNSLGLLDKNDQGYVTIKITGDDMTLTDGEGTTQLTRISPEVPAWRSTESTKNKR